MLRRLAPAFVVDVGANRGQFALDVVTALDAAAVLSVEPLQSEARVFRKVFAGVQRVRLVETALGAHRGRAVIHISQAADSSSLLPITAAQQAVFRGTREVATATVEVTTLDELLATQHVVLPALLKVDVQGYELEVLKGARRTLSIFGWVYLEASFVELYAGQPMAADVIEHLAASGFDLVDLGRPHVAGGRTVQADLLFERRSVSRPPLLATRERLQ
jgi:FkbM family methyltransferase